MLQVIEVDNDIVCIKYMDNKKSKLKKIFNLVTSLNAKTNYVLRGWEIDKQYLKQLEKDFDIQYITQPYMQVGQDLLLQPYGYQREAIYYGLNNLNSLIILPPGAGKLFLSK